MVQVIDPTAGLGQNLAQLTDAIGTLMYPHKKFQLNMQQALATNPALIQHFADLEANAPGTLDRLGFGDLTGLIKQTPESAGSLLARELRPDLEQGLADPRMRQEILAKQTGTQTPQEREQQDLGIQAQKTANANADIELKQHQQAWKEFEQILQKYPDLNKIDANKLVKDLAAGKNIDLDAAARIMHSPVGPVFEILLRNMGRLDEIKFRTQQRDEDNKKEDTFWQKSGFQTWRDSKVGTPQLWSQLLRDPNVMQSAYNFRANPSLAKTTEDKQLAMMADYMESEVAVRNQAQRKSLYAQLQDAHKNYIPGTEGSAAALSNINEILRQYHAAGAPDFIAEEGDTGEPGFSKRMINKIAGKTVYPNSRGLIFKENGGTSRFTFDDLTAAEENGASVMGDGTKETDPVLHRYPPEDRPKIARENRVNKAVDALSQKGVDVVAAMKAAKQKAKPDEYAEIKARLLSDGIITKGMKDIP